MSIERDAKAISAATSGPTTPNSIRIIRPATVALACQVVALTAAVILAAAIVYVLAFQRWPEHGEVAIRRVDHLGWMGLACIACIAVSAISQFFAKVDASAGGNHLALSRDDVPSPAPCDGSS